MEKIELEIGVERPVFECILSNPKKITYITKDMYEKFMNYMLQEEMYEHIEKLKSIKFKVIDTTFEELVKEPWES